MRLTKNIRFFSKVIIGNTADPLLIRWTIVRFKSWGIFLHKLCRSDFDRALHDHPWSFISVVLKGGYDENIEDLGDGIQRTLRHKPGDVLMRPAEWKHRVIIKDKPAWTLVFVGPRKRNWGFFTPTGWCWWRLYNTRLAVCEEQVLHHDGKD